MDLSTAYDGMSKRRQSRALQPKERDILCRILDDIFHQLRVTGDLNSLMFQDAPRGIRMYPEEIAILVDVHKAINPRSD